MNLEYSHENHLEMVHASERPGLSSQPDFKVTLGRVARTFCSPLKESIIAANLIQKQASGQPISLLVSGGIDSEAMMRSFLLAKVPFKAYMMRFSSELNQYDLEDGILFCAENAIQINFLDIDPIEKLTSSYFLETVERYRCPIGFTVLHSWMVENTPGFIVSAGHPRMYYIGRDKVLYSTLPVDETNIIYRTLRTLGRSGVPHFFLYTPEQIASFDHLPVNFWPREFGKNQVDNFYQHKLRTYRQGGLDVHARFDKFTGFEMLDRYYYEKHGTALHEVLQSKIKSHFPGWKFEIPFVAAFRSQSSRRS